MLKQLLNKIANIIEGDTSKMPLSELSWEDTKAIKLDDIPFKYAQNRVWFEMAGAKNLNDMLYGIGSCVVLNWFFLTHPCYLVDVEDTMHREYGCSMLEHISGFDFGNDDITKERPTGFCITVHNIIDAYKAGREYKMMPFERFKLCVKVWSMEDSLNHCHFARELFLKHHKPGEEDKVFGWWPTEEYLKEREAELMAAINKVDEWDKENGYDNGLLYAC